MQLDPALYAHHLDGFEMSDTDKQAFMQQLWDILASFVDRAWGESSEQILLGIRHRDSTALAAPGNRDPLDSGDTISSTFNTAAG